ncbi:MAG: DUF2071 domain-containing protein [Flavobacterium sp.]|nr:DUF2071 domain-containing protein [Pedobacter sp.]
MTENFLSAQWENLIMANYVVNPDVLMPYLPHGVELDFHNDKAYVSLVGFMFKRSRIFNIAIPFLGTFEEVNLRFYVKRVDGDTIKRGVVFINETVPYKLVAWLANKLYKEHYISIPTKNLIKLAKSTKDVRYEWKINKRWNHIQVNAEMENIKLLPGSMEEFIFEHYYGYTKLTGSLSQEYEVNHPGWNINKVNHYSIFCDFESMYGNDFAPLSNQQPESVLIAEGSAVTVKWKRTVF